MSGGTAIYKTSSGDITLWVDGGIHLKVTETHNDPLELSEDEARELAAILLKLADG